MNRYLGLYRPWGYKKNIYMIFRTTSPRYHAQTLREIYSRSDFQEMYEMGYLFGGSTFALIPKPKVEYSQKSYVNYKLKFDQLLNKLEKDGNIVNRKITDLNIKCWPTGELSDVNFIDADYFKKLCEHLEE